MSRNPGDILRDALALPPDARAALAASLWDSLDPEPDTEVENAWREEVRLRLAELDGGAIAGVPWSEARSRILAKLGDER